MSDIIKPDPTSQYWIYIMSTTIWEDYQKYDQLQVSSYSSYNIKSGDIIIFYVKNKRISGFCGVAKTSSKQKKNTSVWIFKDMNMNKYLIDLESMTTFDLIKLDNIYPYIKMDSVGYKNLASFRSKYLKGTDCMTKLDCRGDVIVTKFYDLTTPASETIKQDTQIEQVNSEDQLVEDDVVPEEQSEVQSEVQVVDQAETITNNNLIPIMIVLCKDFRFPDNHDAVEYFKQHYKTCRDCDVTNNNMTELGSILNDPDTETEIIQVNEDNIDTPNSDFNNILNSYHDQVGYDLGQENCVKIYCIDNNKNHDTYSNCLLIAIKN